MATEGEDAPVFQTLEEGEEPVAEIVEEEEKPASQPLEWRQYIRLAVGEFPLRNFYVARLWFPVRARANILVTNLRVVMYGVGGRGILGRAHFVQSVHLDKVVGVESFLGWGFNFWMLGGGLLLMILGLLPYLNVNHTLSSLATPRLAYLWYALIGVGILLMILSFRRLFYVVVKAMALSAEVSVTARWGFGWSNYPNLQFSQRPGPDAQTLVRELGAIILDAQNGEATPEPPLTYPLRVNPPENPLARR